MCSYVLINTLQLKKRKLKQEIFYRDTHLIIKSDKLLKNKAKGWLILATNQSYCEMTFSYLQLLRNVLKLAVLEILLEFFQLGMEVNGHGVQVYSEAMEMRCFISLNWSLVSRD